jgi:hypothetical protein
MKGKLLLFLIALPFFGVGVWMAYSVSSNLLDAWQMRQWVPVQATLTRAGYETHSGDDSTSYEAYAEYNYSYGDRDYSNDRVAIATGADNLGDFHVDIGRRLSAAMSRGEAVIVFVNPDDPGDSILNRTVRWALLGFDAIFLLVFGGVGLGLLVFLFRTPVTKKSHSTGSGDQPWLANEKWQSGVVRSNSKASMYFTWGFALFWNLISAPLPFVIYEEVLEKNNLPALIGLLFPVVGIGLLVWAIRSTLEWRRFGAAPLKLDPFPGSIGGNVGGTIDVRYPFDSNAKFSLTLTNLRSSVSGSGKNRSRSESALYQDAQMAHSSVGTSGTRLSFRFDVPEELTESDADQSDETYYLWRLNLEAELPGTDIDRNYEIPVYATGEHSRQLSSFSIQRARSEQAGIDLDTVRKSVRMSFDASGKAMRFPLGRNLTGGIVGILFGGIFAGVGWFLVMRAGHAFMGSVFGIVGSLVLLSSLYAMLNSLDIWLASGYLKTLRRILGIPAKRSQLALADIERFDYKSSMQTQSGGKHVMHYSVRAVGRSGQTMVVGEGFKGVNEAKAAIEFVAREFGLQSAAEFVNPESEPGSYNILTAD